jgi:outer membrane protein TolC
VVLHADRRVIVARLNALLHRPPGSALPPAPAELATLSRAGEVIHAAAPERLEEHAIAQRPEIAAAIADVRARAAEVSAADLAGYPDLGIMGSYNSMWGDEEHRWMTGLSVSLPLWRDRVRGAQAESEARLAVAKRNLQALQDQVRSEVRQAYERATEAHHIAELFVSRLLPAARDQLRAARAGVESGIDSFLSLIEAEKNLRDVELGYEEAQANLDRRLVALARQLGCLPGDLFAVMRSLVLPRPAEPAGQGDTL